MMRRLAWHIALVFPLCIHAQDGSLGNVPLFRTGAFDAAAVAVQDAQREADGDLPLYSRNLLLNVSSAMGAWSVEGGERVCRMAISSPGAEAMELLLEDVEVPAGAILQVFDAQGHALSGLEAVLLPEGVHEYATALVPGDGWVLEYREPDADGASGRFTIAQVGHAYRDVESEDAREGTCHVNVACHPESDGWEGPIRATVRISVVTPLGNGWCSGTLVNNVRQDCAPYILSAWHCGRTSTTAQFNQYKFYFNFQYATCNGGAYSTAQFMTGAQLKAYSDDYAPQYGGLGGSDFMLLRTNLSVPDAFDPYWAGWDATNISSVTADGVCVHHPTGAPKRISSYTQTLITGHPMASSGLMSHYKVVWAQTQHGWGITEEGSSGAGLFKQIAGTGPVLIGTCTGNSSGMNCSNHAGYAYFGKMSYHWTQNPNAANIKLKPWLDPDNTGTLVLAGSDDPCTITAGIADMREARGLSLAPNPANDQVVLGLPAGSMLPARVLLTDALGRHIAEWTMGREQQQLDLRDVPAGAYFISLLQPNQAVRTGRILITH
ncbi:MAG: T9SS type A sorting domain-containing protein [Bacteroidetes bacterium]|nr:T9SS type A sorting domain-containing protein [Bacteroidota bacterium]